MTQDTTTRSVTSSLVPTTIVDPELLEPFVHLENIEEPEYYKYITLAEIYRLWQRMRDGYSAQGYRPNDCPVYFEEGFIYIELSFYALPSTPELEYDLSVTIGDISDPEVIALERELDILFPLDDHYDLEFYPNTTELEWNTGCWNFFCEEVDPPDIEQIDYRLYIGEKLFGVARFDGTAYCREYKLNLVLEKGDNRITGLQPVITASWRNLEGKTDCWKHSVLKCAQIMTWK